MSQDGWTIDELAERTATALASEGVPAPNGRVTAVPDRRVIRWYATIGLLDRPLRIRGRTARYGERHLLQLMAVKRRQAEGRTLMEIQAELAGATDATLRRVAGLPYGSAVDRAAGTPPSHPGTPQSLPGAPRSRPEQPPRPRFWTEPPDPTVTPDPAGTPAPPATPAPAARSAPPATPAATPAPAALRPVYPLALHPEATLVLSARPGPDDLAAIEAAARPLLDLLARRGLLTDRTEESS